ncbi:hypothetical protein AC579_2119 [Pseudocercospora musae]|uniref:Uncharacterized protein n=1 Tax=Pseudocercospora musae TaxID=113226 RepID=A0A139I4U9_9PEZI|nr:hypothetical protein AC579_2119 [Pseudocercospora musae]
MAEFRATTTRENAAKKTHHASNLKSSRTALVVLHHAATSYGGEGRSPYQSSYHGQASSPALVGFNAINQSFYMINDHAFSAFVVHIPVMTVLGCATDKWRANGVVKTAVIGGATVVTSWVAGLVGSEIWSRTERLWQRCDKKQECPVFDTSIESS